MVVADGEQALLLQRQHRRERCRRLQAVANLLDGLLEVGGRVELRQVVRQLAHELREHDERRRRGGAVVAVADGGAGADRVLLDFLQDGEQSAEPIRGRLAFFVEHAFHLRDGQVAGPAGAAQERFEQRGAVSVNRPLGAHPADGEIEDGARKRPPRQDGGEQVRSEVRGDVFQIALNGQLPQETKQGPRPSLLVRSAHDFQVVKVLRQVTQHRPERRLMPTADGAAADRPAEGERVERRQVIETNRAALPGGLVEGADRIGVAGRDGVGEEIDEAGVALAPEHDDGIVGQAAGTPIIRQQTVEGLLVGVRRVRGHRCAAKPVLPVGDERRGVDRCQLHAALGVGRRRDAFDLRVQFHRGAQLPRYQATHAEGG